MTLIRRKRVTLDIDATVIEAHQKGVQYSYKKCPGNAPPGKDNPGFIRQCTDALPAGVRVFAGAH